MPSTKPSPHPESVIADLASCARAGERVDANALLKALRPAVVRFCRRRKVAWADTEDVAQNTLLKLAEALAVGIVPRRSYLAWAYTLVNFEILTFRKQCKRRREIHDTDLASRSVELRETGNDVWVTGVEWRHAVVRVCQDYEALLRDLVADPDGGSSARLRKRKQRAIVRLYAAVDQSLVDSSTPARRLRATTGGTGRQARNGTKSGATVTKVP